MLQIATFHDPNLLVSIAPCQRDTLRLQMVLPDIDRIPTATFDAQVVLLRRLIAQRDEFPDPVVFINDDSGPTATFAYPVV